MYNCKLYALFAVLCLSAFQLGAAVVYKDIKPDYIYTGGDHMLNLDLNNDKTVDFVLRFTYLGSSDIWVTMEALNDNQVAMESTSPSSFAKPFQLSEHIDASATWQNGQALPIAYRTSDEPEGSWHGIGDACVGLQLDVNGQKHYGWLRINVSDDVKKLTIKDYAYEDAVNTAIIPASSPATAVAPAAPPFAFDCYLQNRTLQLYIPDAATSEACVINMSGQLVLRRTLNGEQAGIDMQSLPAGIYILSLTSNDRWARKEILIE